MTTTAVLTDAQRSVTKGKLKARTWMPYLSHIFSIMRLHVTEDVEIAGVDRFGKLAINEKNFSALPTEQAAYVLLHEVLHIVLNHWRRFLFMRPEGEDLVIWNVAADLCIQQLLSRHHSDAEFDGLITIDGEIPGTEVPFLTVVKKGWTTEQYFNALVDHYDKGDNRKKLQKYVEYENAKPVPLDPRKAGSNSGSTPSQDCSERMNVGVVEEAMLESALRSTEDAMQKAESDKPGSVPGGMAKSLSTRLHQVPDPFDELRHCVSQSVASPLGNDYYTRSKRSRRQRYGRPRQFGIVRYAPECTIIIDTSGSMYGLEEKALSVISQGLKRVQQPRVVCFDAAKQDDKRMQHISQFEWKGGGGTDMTKAIEEADKTNADAIVVVTDCETEWPSKRTRARLIVAAVKESKWSQPPEWARVIHCYKEVNTYEC